MTRRRLVMRWPVDVDSPLRQLYALAVGDLHRACQVKNVRAVGSPWFRLEPKGVGHALVGSVEVEGNR